MSDRSAAEICIGGTLNDAAAIDRLIEAIMSDNAGPEYGSRFRDCAEALDCIKQALAASEPLRLFDDQANGGAFWDLEKVLRELALTYFRANDGHYAYSAEAVFWEPGYGEPRSWTGANEHAPCLTATEIRKLSTSEGALAAELDLMECAKKSEFPLRADASALDAALTK
jgi:hypothetical protein